MRPRIGVETVLIYRECPHGCWCATGEADVAPRCGGHGEFMLPSGTPSEGGPAFGRSFMDQRRLRGLGFRARLANETALVEGKTVDEAVKIALDGHWHLPPEPYFERDRIAEAAAEIEAAKVAA